MVVDKPAELERAERVIGLCRRFGALPYAGGMLDQPAEFLQLIKIYDIAHGALEE
jgi:hypothetical protein